MHKVTIVPRGQALGYTLNLPEEDRYLRTREELLDEIRVLLGGRAAEQVVFGRVSTGAANDLERVTAIARAMVFDFGMGDTAHSRTLRADNYALLGGDEAPARRRAGGASATAAYETRCALVEQHREPLDRLAEALLERETLDREEVLELLADVPVRSDESAAIGTLLALFDQPYGDGRPDLRLRPRAPVRRRLLSSPSAAISACLASRAASASRTRLRLGAEVGGRRATRTCRWA